MLSERPGLSELRWKSLETGTDRHSMRQFVLKRNIVILLV